MSEVKFNLELIEEYNKSKGKVKQVIWLPLQDFTKVLELYQKTNIPINVIISSMVMAVVRNTSLFEKSIEKPVEKVVKETKTIWPCYFCWAEFNDMNELKKHLQVVHNTNLQSLIKT